MIKSLASCRDNAYAHFGHGLKSVQTRLGNRQFTDRIRRHKLHTLSQNDRPSRGPVQALNTRDIVHDQSLNQNFGKLHALHVSALTRHLIECRRVFDGDLDLFLVFTIIGERTFNVQSAPEGMSFDDFISVSVSSVRPAAINLQSIADFSGIPRETVRRKIAQLIEKGWVQRDERKFVTATDQAKDNLFELTQSAVRFLRDISPALSSLQTA